MSISQPKINNPCKKFIEFKGDAGVFQHYDKENKKNVTIPYPISFIVLDELSTIKGFNEASASGIYANEVHSVKYQTLTVRTFKGNNSISGLYADIKDQVKSIGGKYCKSIYAALIHKDQSLELVNFQLTGAAFKAWVDKVVDPSEFVVTIKGTHEGKKGKVVYQIPEYHAAALPEELKEKAIDMDHKLQEFLKSKKAEHKEEVQDSPEVESQPDADEPF